MCNTVVVPHLRLLACTALPRATASGPSMLRVLGLLVATAAPSAPLRRFMLLMVDAVVACGPGTAS